MKNGFPNLLIHSQGIISVAFSITSLGIIGFSFPSYSQSFESEYLPEQREIHDTFSDDQKEGSLLDATNQMNLMNRLRQSMAMENATSPSDAIDEALKALDAQQIEGSLLE